jgi:hypothetical protein
MIQGMLKPVALLLALVFAPPAFAQGMAFPVHGNWCGPNHGAGPVLDLLDAACMRHDMCVAQAGLLDCGCDLAFMDELRHGPWPNPMLATKARAVYEIIAIAPCTDPDGHRFKLSRAANDWARDVALGYEPPWAVLDRLGALFAEGMARGY